MERQPTAWETVFTNDASGKGWISKIYKGLIQLSTHKKPHNPIKKMCKGPGWTLLQRGYIGGQ